jgi:uncharacterized protein (TIGR02246 family)
MRLSTLAAAVVLAGASFVLAACGGNTGAGDEAAIRDLNKKWLEAIVAKDASAVAMIYADDGAMLPPNAPKAAGRDAVEKSWGEMFKIPGVALTFETERFVFAKSGDVAIDIGTYKFTAGEGAAAATDIGKSVVTWVKRDGKWYVLTDMFSSDAPPPAPAPATPAAPAETPAVEPSSAPMPVPPAPAKPPTP